MQTWGDFEGLAEWQQRNYSSFEAVKLLWVEPGQATRAITPIQCPFNVPTVWGGQPMNKKTLDLPDHCHLLHSLKKCDASLPHITWHVIRSHLKQPKIALHLLIPTVCRGAATAILHLPQHQGIASVKEVLQRGSSFRSDSSDSVLGLTPQAYISHFLPESQNPKP